MTFLGKLTSEERFNLWVTLLLGFMIAAFVALALFRWIDEQRTVRHLQRIISLEAQVADERAERLAQTAVTRVLVLEMADEPTIVKTVEKINAQQKGRVSPVFVGLLTELRQRKADKTRGRVRAERDAGSR